MSGRIFSVRINLDDIHASLRRWRERESRGDWLDGFLDGCDGINQDGSDPYTQGNKIGLESYGQAVSFQTGQSDKAKKRWNATAMPRHESGNATAMPKHMPEAMPEACLSNNPIIEESKEREIEKTSERVRFAPPTEDQVRAYCDERNNRVDPAAFVAYYESNGWKVGKGKMVSWQGAIRTWEKKDGFKPAPQPDQAFTPFEETSEGKACEARKAELQARVDARKAQASP